MAIDWFNDVLPWVLPLVTIPFSLTYPEYAQKKRMRFYPDGAADMHILTDRELRRMESFHRGKLWRSETGWWDVVEPLLKEEWERRTLLRLPQG